MTGELRCMVALTIVAAAMLSCKPGGERAYLHVIDMPEPNWRVSQHAFCEPEKLGIKDIVFTNGVYLKASFAHSQVDVVVR